MLLELLQLVQLFLYLLFRLCYRCLIVCRQYLHEHILIVDLPDLFLPQEKQ